MSVGLLPLAPGSTGDAVRDVQQRLQALGFVTEGDDPGRFGASTGRAIATFQGRRGLDVDGVCGLNTWNALVEAGYRVGDRPLYLTHPMLRGDDVADLQRQLGALGFDAGRVDGIFGPRTDRALADFQRNDGLITDSICGPATIAALRRLDRSCDAPYSVATVREREQVRQGPPTLQGRVVAIGCDAACGPLGTAVRAVLAAVGGLAVALTDGPLGDQAPQAANTAGADVYVGFASVAAGAPCTTAYYRSPGGWESTEGRRLAEDLQRRVSAAAGTADGGTRGMAIPILRETRMPALVVEVPAAAIAPRLDLVAAAVTAALQTWLAPQIDP